MIAPYQRLNQYNYRSGPTLHSIPAGTYSIVARPPATAPVPISPVNTPHFNHIAVTGDAVMTKVPPTIAGAASAPASSTASGASGSSSGASGCSSCQQRAQAVANLVKGHPVAAIAIGAFALWLVLR